MNWTTSGTPSVCKNWINAHEYYKKKVKVKWSRYRPGVAQRVGRGIALLFHDRGTRRGWVVSSTSRPHFTPEKDPVPILQEAGWAPGPVWMGGKSCPHQDLIPDRPARSQSLYWLSHLAHTHKYYTKAKLQYNTPILIWHNVVSTACSLAQLFVDIYTFNIQEQNKDNRSIKVMKTGFCILNS